MTTIHVDDEITLRWSTMADAEPLFALIDANRAYLARWLPAMDGIRTVEDERQWVEGRLKVQEEGTGTPGLVEYRGALVGSVGVDWIDYMRKVCEIGYFLAEDMQGRGIITRSCAALLDYIFHTLGLNRAQIRAMPENTRSVAVPQRLGFVYEGVQRQAQQLNGQFYDFAVYSMLASEWAKLRAGERSSTR